MITFLTSLLLANSLTASAQGTQKITRSDLARMDVLSRAKLFEATIERVAASEGVDPLILWTIAYNETRFRPWQTSPKNAQGLMQFMPGTAARFGLVNPYEPASSLIAAARYVKYLGHLFDWKLESILAAYNAGEGTVSAYLQGREIRLNGKVINASRLKTGNGVPPYKETIGYVSQGVRVYRWLQEQGRLGMPKNESGQNATADRSSAPEKSKTRQVISVFYDPRTGKRTVIGSLDAVLQLQLDFGPVIVGPTISKNIKLNARSTFAGPSGSEDPR